MEEDDDFGELYSDVLPPTKTPPFQIRRPIDLNKIDSDDEEQQENYFSAQNSDFSKINDSQSDNLLIQQKGIFDNDNQKIGGGEKGVLEKKEGFFGGSGFGDEEIEVVVEERDDKGESFVEKDDDLVEKNEIRGNFEGFGGVEDCGTMIPGVSGRGELNFEEESDSESEDDLQIVLNNDSEMGVMGMERMGGMGGGDEEDEDEDNLVILAGNDSLGNVGMMENPEWGEEGGTGTDGERKEAGDGAKVNGGVAVHAKAQYGNNAFYHPFHSQFKVSDVAHLGYAFTGFSLMRF